MDYENPILSTEYLLNTPTVMSVVEHACFKVLMRKTGVVFAGEARIGKTRCCETLVKEIPRKFPKVYTFMLVATNKDLNPQYSSIIHHLIELEKLEPRPRATFIQRQAMLIERLKHRAAERKAKQIVLIIDELQRLSARDFDQLADLYNTLRMHAITLTVISFAMPSIEERVIEFLENDFQHMIGRFLSDIKPLFGVTSLRNLATVLALYDEQCAEGTNESYTASNVPIAYKDGFRLNMLAEDIWREMSRVASGKYIKNLPMEHLTQVVSYLFLILSHEDRINLNVPQDLISEAVHESNFEQFCRKVDLGEK